MNAELKKLYDQKGKAHTEMQKFGDKLKKGEKLTEEEEKQFNSFDEEYKSANDAITKLKLLDDRETEKAVSELKKQEGNPGNEGKKEKTIFTSAEGRSAWKKGMSGARLTEKEKKIFDTVADQDEAFRRFINLGFDALDDNEREIVQEMSTKAASIWLEANKGQRAQTVTTTGGGYTIPQGFWDDIVMYKKLVSPFFEEAKIGPSGVAKSIFYFINSTSGNDLPMPTIDDTGVTGELLAINTDAFGNTADMTFGQIIMKAYKYSPKPMKVPRELMDDTGIDLAGLIPEVLGTRNGRKQNLDLTTGDNTNKPQGIVTGSTQGKISAGNDAITFSDIIDLEHSVNPAYRKSSSARFMFSDGILKYLKKLTIGSATNDSRPLWSPSYREGVPDTIDGFQYLLNEDMAAAVADQAKVMLFGDMKQYAIRQAGAPLLRFLGERFADTDQVAWVLFERLDGRYRNTSGIKYLEVS